MPVDWGSIGTWVAIGASLGYNIFNHRRGARVQRGARFEAQFGEDLARAVSALREAKKACSRIHATVNTKPAGLKILKADVQRGLRDAQTVLTSDVSRITTSSVPRHPQTWRSLVAADVWDPIWDAYAKANSPNGLAEFFKKVEELEKVIQILHDRLLRARELESV